jgi:hypothetical protein
MPRAWIQLPADPGWGGAALLKTALGNLGYYVSELRGEGPPWLWITGSRVAEVPGTPRRQSLAGEPVLEQAMPSDALPGSGIGADAAVEIRLRDGSWVHARVAGQRRDRQGRWCVHLRWVAGLVPGGREGVYVYDPEYIRRLPGEGLEAQRGGGPGGHADGSAIGGGAPPRE